MFYSYIFIIECVHTRKKVIFLCFPEPLNDYGKSHLVHLYFFYSWLVVAKSGKFFPGRLNCGRAANLIALAKKDSSFFFKSAKVATAPCVTRVGESSDLVAGDYFFYEPEKFPL